MIYYMNLDIVSICRIGSLFYTIPISILVSKYISSSECNLETVSNSAAKNIKYISLYFL